MRGYEGIVWMKLMACMRAWLWKNCMDEVNSMHAWYERFTWMKLMGCMRGYERIAWMKLMECVDGYERIAWMKLIACVDGMKGLPGCSYWHAWLYACGENNKPQEIWTHCLFVLKIWRFGEVYDLWWFCLILINRINVSSVFKLSKVDRFCSLHISLSFISAWNSLSA